MSEGRCPNLSHGLASPLVRHCPECGLTVNKAIMPCPCSLDKHSMERWNRNAFCPECGKKVIG